MAATSNREKAAVGIVVRLARQPAVDHHAHAGQGDRRFGHIGGQHNASAALRVGLQYLALRLHRQLAVQRQHLHRRVQHILQCAVHARDFAVCGQKHQHVAGMCGQGVLHRAPRLRLQRFVAARGEMRNLHRETAPGTAQARSLQKAGQALTIERGRHRHDAQVFAHLRLHIQCQRQAEVAGQMAFVEFVEQQHADAVQHRVVLDQPGQDAFGDDFNAGARRCLVLEADAVAHHFADRLAELARHELRRAAGRHAARLQHHDLATGQPWRLQQRQRHLGGLAGAGRRFQHQPRMRGETVANLRQQRGYRKNEVGHAREGYGLRNAAATMWRGGNTGHVRCASPPSVDRYACVRPMQCRLCVQCHQFTSVCAWHERIARGMEFALRATMSGCALHSTAIDLAAVV